MAIKICQALVFGASLGAVRAHEASPHTALAHALQAGAYTRPLFSSA